MSSKKVCGELLVQAARYQMIIMFIIASTTSVASMAVISLAAFTIVDQKARLQGDLLSKKKKPTAWTKQVREAIVQVMS